MDRWSNAGRRSNRYPMRRSHSRSSSSNTRSPYSTVSRHSSLRSRAMYHPCVPSSLLTGYAHPISSDSGHALGAGCSIPMVLLRRPLQPPAVNYFPADLSPSALHCQHIMSIFWTISSVPLRMVRVERSVLAALASPSAISMTRLSLRAHPGITSCSRTTQYLEV
jgi:hypothetical protein